MSYLASSSLIVFLNFRHKIESLSLQVLHLSGHSPGSVGLRDARNGILISGGTLYQVSQI